MATLKRPGLVEFWKPEMGEVLRREFAWLDERNRRIERFHRQQAAAAAWGGLIGMIIALVAAVVGVYLGWVPV